MKVLFVSSGNSKWGITPIVKAQGESFLKQDVELLFYLIEGKGLSGYLRNVYRLKKKVDSCKPDLIHAHYSLSGWVTIMACPFYPKVLSFMGSDTYGLVSNKDLTHFFLRIQRTLIQFFFKSIIVKSKQLYNYIWFKKKCYIIPNGVNLNHFIISDKKICRRELGMPLDDTILLFMGDPKDQRKNFTLAVEALKFIKTKLKIIAPFPYGHESAAFYYNAADLLIFTSILEGSPNVIKEAMACNCPIVTTDVGDVRYILGGTNGCFITKFSAEDVAAKIESALKFVERRGRTNGRQRILELGLDADTIAKKLIAIYENVLERKH